MTAEVLGLGVSTVDVLALVEHFPAGDEVQRAQALRVQGGGPVATALVALARLGARTAMLDAVGDDWRGRLILEAFDEEQVDTSHILVRPGHSSALASILVKQGSGERAIIYDTGTAPELLPGEVPQELVETARYLHVNGRHWAACLRAVEYARQARVCVSFDGGAGRYRPELRQLIPQVDVCIVARQFASQYSGASEMPAAAQALLSEGPELVVITDGVRGSWVFPRQGDAFHQPACLMPQVVDTTGCGDAYHGAFLFGLLRGLPLPQTATLASRAAALNSQALGGRGGLPRQAEVEAC